MAGEKKVVIGKVRGKTAYEYAVEGGYTGTEAAFAAKLAAEKFANPNALTFTGAVTGSYDGSEPLTVEIPSGGSIAIDDTLTVSGAAADAKAVGDKITSLSEEIAALSGSGISATARNLLIAVLRNGVYSSDQSANITALETALGGSGTSTPTDPDTPTYTISNELVNVTSNNSAASIAEGSSYTATLTANDGYTLGSVTVTMGGVDVTSDVYADGVINIASVTGNVEIVASASVADPEPALPEDGLVDVFDMRNITDNTETSGKSVLYSTNGAGSLFTWASEGLLTSNNYGANLANRDWVLSTSEELGEARTVIFMAYNGCVSYRSMLNQADNTRMTCIPMYEKSDGSAVSGTSSTISFTPFDSGYIYPAVRCDANKLTLFTNGEQLIEYESTNFDNFVAWTFPNVRPKDTSPYLTAIVVYNRALSDVELTDAMEYLRTLEATA